MKKYFYLDGPERKGPFTEEEFINLKLSHETLIWTEGFDNWKPLKDFPDLLRIIPPPLPENTRQEVTKIKKSKKVRFSFLTLLVLLITSFIIVYFVIKTNKTKYKQELSDRIERTFDGKTIICDGVNYGVKGELKKIPTLSPSEEDRLFYNNRVAHDEYVVNKKEGIIEKFFCFDGGFTFKKLKKSNLGFELEVITSNNMAFISTNYNRGTIDEAYNSAYDFFVNKNSGCYLSGYYELIENFSDLNNKYFYLKNTERPSSPFSQMWTNGEGHINNGYRIVYYKSEGWYYEISERNWNIWEDYLKILSLTGGISVLLFLLLLTLNPFKW